MRGPAIIVVCVVCVVSVVSVVGCVGHSDFGGDPPVGGGSGRGPAGGPNASCLFTSDCAPGALCTRNNECWAADQVRTIHAAWTLSGMPASATTCTTATANDLFITFRASQGLGAFPFSFVPVPCVEGKFSIDRMSPQYDRVDLGRASSRNGGLEEGMVDDTGTAQIDLPY